MSLTTSLYSAAMRSVYEPKIREQVNNSNIVTKFRKQHKDDVQWQGNEVVVHLHSGRNYSGVKSTGESGFLGVAGNQQYAKLSIPIRDLKARFGITAEVINASESEKGAAAPAMTREMEGVGKDVERQLNRQLFGFGAGTLGLAASGTGSVTQTVNSPGGVAGTTNPTRFIKPNMYVAFTATDGTNVRVQQVSSVNNANNSITLASTLTSNTGDLISIGTVSGSTNGSSFNKEMMGLLGIVDQTTYVNSPFGVDRSNTANSFYFSSVYTSAGSLSEDLLYRYVDNQEEISGERVDSFFSHFSIRREYLKLSQADRRYQGADLRNPDAGADFGETMTFGGIQWAIDKDAPYGTLIGVVSDHLFVIYLNEGQWEDWASAGGASTVLRPVADKTDYEAVWYMMLNAYADRGNCHFRSDGISATVTSGVFAD
jgi:hypothetical protein